MTQPVLRNESQVRPWTRSAASADDVWDELDRLRDNLRRLLGGLGWPETPDLSLGSLAGLAPLADIEETDDAYVVEVELPGVRKDDVTVSVEGRRLSVDAERRERERAGVLRRRSRTVGHLHYEAVMPGEVDEENTTASLDDGVLTVRLGKPALRRARRIPIG
ncbi:MAG: Hsp20/alpha crystallin family protein [Actinomycetota bacterium]|jgi:HSP20 family protein|nr:Hsp20/alpha crystallin family protein [Actinomycetota bacterium]